jgi:F0F1-type ATP synthase assembly protein I
VNTVDKKQTTTDGQKPPSDARYYGFAMRIVGDFGATIAIPAVIAAFVGVWVDEKLGTAPWLLLGSLAVAGVLTAYIIQKKAKAYGKKFDALNKKV